MTAARRGLEVDAGRDDSRAGLAMFLIFIAAVLSVTGVVALVAFVGRWWMLGGAFAFHVLMTTLVVVTIARVMDDRVSTAADRRPAANHRRESRPPAPTEPLAAL